ncbi:hypothetical protein [Luteimonas fraxinea]|uniref:Uncharacterized protein n=1 Tax=Luteimonas fraxinea TaxID=2901869 RepID=A0ABS8UC57_9GAMM|nr:hypothetical protein [Luteimonas fraxinea]MCD9097088.1 hypothetical protein [Luteimonas fraxinea]
MDRSNRVAPIGGSQIFATGIAALVMGGILGALVFGDSAGLITSKADRLIAALAAVGTWVVGLGAWYYASQAHQLRELEVSRAASAEAVKAVDAFNRARATVLSCVVPHSLLDDARLELKRMPLTQMKTLVAAAAASAPGGKELLRSVPMPLDEAVVKSMPLAAALEIFHQSATAVLALEEHIFYPVHVAYEDEINALIEGAGGVRDLAIDLASYMDENRSTLTAQANP